MVTFVGRYVTTEACLLTRICPTFPLADEHSAFERIYDNNERLKAELQKASGEIRQLLLEREKLVDISNAQCAQVRDLSLPALLLHHPSRRYNRWLSG